jgi:signal transduction histidine kinase
MLLVSGSVALLLGAAFVLLLFSVANLRDAGRLALRSQEAITAGSELQKSVINLDNGLRGYVASGRERFLDPWNAGLRAYRGQLRQLDRLVSDDSRSRARVRAISTEIDDYVNLWGRPLLSLARDRLPAARSALVTGAGRDRIDSIRQQFASLFARERAVAAARERKAESSSGEATAAGVGGLALVLGLAVGIALYLRHSVVRPVKAVAGASAEFAGGDMSARVPVTRRDEIGELATAFNSMADQLGARTVELERSNRELEQFAWVTSHDLQAPLTTISMYAQLLDQRHASQLNGGRELVDGITLATSRAKTLIRDLLEYSRAGRGQLNYEMQPARDIVGEAIDLLAGPLEDAGARVEVGELPLVYADPTKLRGVFQNLISNAIKFCDGSPVVTIAATTEPGCTKFSVTDNGIGMEPDRAEHIFEPFQRLHGEDDYPGTGIGLAICSRVVERHGGRIWAESTPGQGSTFHFTLTAAREARAAAEAGPQAAQ